MKFRWGVVHLDGPLGGPHPWCARCALDALDNYHTHIYIYKKCSYASIILHNVIVRDNILGLIL